ncbi:Potassium inward rectifier (Kir)-like channel 3 [Arabidopsis thaliana]|uniref:KCO3 n=2 Tax=Arabidopsis TaxID=3701 RepID=A0A178UHI1_ARATH|nr:EF-hand domain pair [Arabidopsis thaliana x Arabidopsis arenosa]OAO93155.1 KCO3 [Arabidopsis thaliana]
MPMTPSEFKNRLLFGSLPRSSSDPTDLQSTEPNVPPSLFSLPEHNDDTATDMAPDQETEQSVSKSIARQALALLVVYLSLGVLIYWLTLDSDNAYQTHPVAVALYFFLVTFCGFLIVHFVLRIGWLDSFCFSVMIVTTVGFGDRAFNSWPGTLLAAIWLFVSTLAVARAFLFLTEARADKRNRERAKKVLGQSMSISQFFAADIDDDGCLSLAEFAIYKLKQMEKITQEDFIQICNQFDKLDRTQSGRITLVDLTTATSV